MRGEDIKRVAVVGAGIMGHGIALEFALSGYEVHLHDVSAERLQRALDNVQINLGLMAEGGLLKGQQIGAAMENIHITTSLEEAASDCDLVIEAVTEDLAVKKQVFSQLDRLCTPDAILASNTSSYMPSMLAAATRRPARVLGTHYFNPPFLLPLVEIVGSKDTSQEVIATVYDLFNRIGKAPVVVRKEAPGFIANRLQVAIFREALSIVDKGIATPHELDIAVRNSFGRRLAVAGPFEIFDLAGLETMVASTGEILPDLDSSKEISHLVKEIVARGDLGVKSGKGFYTWTQERAQSVRRKIGQALMKISQWT